MSDFSWLQQLAFQPEPPAPDIFVHSVFKKDRTNFEKALKTFPNPANTKDSCPPVHVPFIQDYPHHTSCMSEDYEVVEMPVSIFPTRWFFHPDIHHPAPFSVEIPLSNDGSMEISLDINRAFMLTSRRSHCENTKLWPLYALRCIRHQKDKSASLISVLTFDIKPFLSQIRELLKQNNADTQPFENWINGLSIQNIFSKHAVHYAEPLPVAEAILSGIQNLSPDLRRFCLNTLCSTLSMQKIHVSWYPKLLSLFMKHVSYEELCKASVCNPYLHMQLSLDYLNRIRNRIFRPYIKPDTPAFFSDEQKQVILCQDPFILVQSGAGTGKTTTIAGRIHQLIHSGINPRDITAVSFTNSAANALSEKVSGITSITLSSLMAEIYEANYPNQTCTNTECLTNILRLIADDKSLPEIPSEKLLEFADLLDQDDKHQNDDAYRCQLAMFLNKNMEMIEFLLGSISHTTLTLQQLICTLNLSRLEIPADFMTHFLIVDEVQDNSTYDFIFTLKLAAICSMNLTLIGDGSQTLYEFRSANSEAMTMLENSGVFTCLKLQTNFRSAQPILDFSNTLLDLLPSNRYARIQLHAPNTDFYQWHPMNQDVEFTSVVNRTSTALEQEIRSFLEANADWIMQSIRSQETIGILCPKRAQVSIFEKVIQEMYKDVPMFNISSQIDTSCTVFSRYLKDKTQLAKIVGSTHAPALADSIRHSVLSSELRKVEQKAYILDKEKEKEDVRNRVQALFERWDKDYHETLEECSQMLSNRCTEAQKANICARIRQTMIHAEISYNAINNTLVRDKNSQIRETPLNSYRIIFSTIHSSKGLEFDKTIVFINQKTRDNKQISDEEKRSWYVALTRAKKEEKILTVSSYPNSLPDVLYEEFEKRRKVCQNSSIPEPNMSSQMNTGYAYSNGY